MTPFTPGPWHLNTLETSLCSVHATRGCVAEVSWGTMNEVSADEVEANARLIAASPSLLSALEWITAQLDDTGCDQQGRLYSSTLGPDTDEETVLQFLKRTIAKARQP